MGGLWQDADEANAASVQQITKESSSMAKNYTGLNVKLWKDMTEEEKKADIAARMDSAKMTKQSAPQQQPQIIQSSCYHDGEDLAFTMFDKSLCFAGAKASLLYDPPLDTKLIIDLCQSIKLEIKPFVLDAPEDLADFKLPPREAPPMLKLRWPDRSEPPITIDWWGRLVTRLREKFSGGRIIITCLGSHGRTGTAMAAILLASSQNLSVENAIKFVRKTHCHKAIESNAQVEYLREFRPKENSKWLDNCAADNFKGFTNVKKP